MNEDRILAHLDASARAMASLRAASGPIARAANVVVERLRAGGTLYTCGNGGSAAQALHLAEELVGNYHDRRRPPQPAVCLSSDSTAMSCIANDFGFENVFARPCSALLTERDVLVAMSTSGSSPNIVKALEAAGEKGAVRVGLLGRDGGDCLGLCEYPIVVEGEHSAHIQEAHLVVIHLICEAVDEGMAP